MYLKIFGDFKSPFEEPKNMQQKLKLQEFIVLVIDL